jgi:uncharacterized small protein (DUF1192 family)
MMQLTPGAQIDELGSALRESERRRQTAEFKLADRDRLLGTACQTIAEQDARIAWLTAELARLRGAFAPPAHDEYMADAMRFFNIYTTAGSRSSAEK